MKFHEIELVNTTEYADKKILEYIRFVIKNLAPIKSIINVSPKNKNALYDSTAYENGVIEIVLNEAKTDFPIIWWPDEKCQGSYVRGTYLENPEEYYIYALSHEIRHLWQWKYPKAIRLGESFTGADEETDADLFAIMKLFEWRNRT